MKEMLNCLSYAVISTCASRAARVSSESVRQWPRKKRCAAASTSCSKIAAPSAYTSSPVAASCTCAVGANSIPTLQEQQGICIWRSVGKAQRGARIANEVDRILVHGTESDAESLVATVVWRRVELIRQVDLCTLRNSSSYITSTLDYIFDANAESRRGYRMTAPCRHVVRETSP